MASQLASRLHARVDGQPGVTFAPADGPALRRAHRLLSPRPPLGEELLARLPAQAAATRPTVDLHPSAEFDAHWQHAGRDRLIGPAVPDSAATPFAPALRAPALPTRRAPKGHGPSQPSGPSSGVGQDGAPPPRPTVVDQRRGESMADTASKPPPVIAATGTVKSAPEGAPGRKSASPTESAAPEFLGATPLSNATPDRPRVTAAVDGRRADALSAPERPRRVGRAGTPIVRRLADTGPPHMPPGTPSPLQTTPVRDTTGIRAAALQHHASTAAGLADSEPHVLVSPPTASPPAAPAGGSSVLAGGQPSARTLPISSRRPPAVTGNREVLRRAPTETTTSDNSSAPTGIPGAVPIPASSPVQPGAGAAPEIGDLADRVYDLLVRRLAVERERKGLAP